MAEILPVEIETADSSWLQGKTREELRHHVLAEAQRPLVLRRCTDSWTEARSWSPLAVCRILGDKSTTFKVCPRRGTDVFRQKFSEREVIFETQCEHVQASFLNFAEWLEKSENEALSALEEDAEPHPKKLKSEENSPSLSLPSSSNPLLSFPPSQYWVYADYKYMCQLCEDRPELIRAIDWGVLGFTGRGGAESTMWVGSQESCTPCHYDTYGCNLVAQLWGRKKWTLFSPDDSPQLYPTRIPYEESSVFSEVNVEHPDLEQYPNFASATGYQVVLEAGDVLFVPRQWWHYVECIEPAVSVNTWIDLPSDSYERVKEAVVRTMMAGWLPGRLEAVHSQEQEGTLWVNPNEEVFPHAENLRLLSLTINEHQRQKTEAQVLSESTHHQSLLSPPHTSQTTPHQWVKALTSDTVAQAITDHLLATAKFS